MKEDKHDLLKGDKRASRKWKALYGPGGGTRAAQQKRMEVNKGFEKLSKGVKRHLGIGAKKKGSKRSGPSFI
ncbi:MAG: hypothetical protein Q7R79_01765 [bacterium]|nr:hypothetical protein [bacterium]